MKISCQSCAAKYTIADDKVVGKVIKLKCKKCSNTIVVNGNDPAVLAELQGGGGYDDQATAMMNQPDLGGANPDEWTVSITDDDQRNMTTDQVVAAYSAGSLSQDTYVWKDGMADWSPLLEVPELAMALSGGSGSAEAPAPEAYQAPQAFEATAQMSYQQAAAPVEAAVPAAARRSGGRGGSVDLFGGGGAPRGASEPPLGMAPGMGADKHIGERNETSVLFSLKDLQAAESQANKAPSKADPFSNKSDRVDDIFSLGGMGAAGPMLAPPPMMAPVIEAPPPPPPPSMPPSAMAAPAYYAPPPQKSSPVPMIIGGLGVLALIGGVIFFVAGSGAKDDTKDEKKTAAADTSKPVETAKPADTAAEPAETATAAPEETASAEPDASGAPTSEAVAQNDKGAAGTGKTDPKTDPKKEDPKKEDPKKEDPKKEDPPAGGGGAFDRGAASAALGGAAGAAKGCKKDGGPTGSTKVQVTFAPSGKATQAVVGAPFAGTPTGSCIASTFKGAAVPPFSGGAMTVSKTVTIK